MLNRASCILALSFCLSAWTGLGQTHLFLLPDPSSTAPTVTAFQLDPFAKQSSFAVQPQAAFFFTNSSGTKYYSVARSSSNTLLVLDAANTARILKRQDLGPATAAVLTPDGRRLLILAGTLYIFDLTNDTLLSTVTEVGNSPSDLAVSLDGSRAFVLSPASNRLFAVDLNTNTPVGSPLTVPEEATGVAVGYSGMVYVTGQNRVLEVDGATMSVNHEIPVDALPGKLTFTPDGRYALAVNKTPATGSSLLLVDLQKRALAGSLQSASVLNSLVLASNSRIYATSTNPNSLWEVSISPFAIKAPQFSSTGSITNVSGLTATAENPSPKYLFAVTPDGVTRLDNSSTPPGVSSTIATPGSHGPLIFAAPVTTGAAARIAGYNNNQAVLLGAAYRPLVTRVFDSTGRPLQGVPVTFTSSDNSNAVIADVTVHSNAQGFAQTRVTAPPTAGVFTVTATAGGGLHAPSYKFILTAMTSAEAGVPGASLTIASGQGQFVREHFLLQEPLTVQLRDSEGKPVANQTITFALHSGMGTLKVSTSKGELPNVTCLNQTNACLAQTDAEGKASVGFFPTTVTPGLGSVPQTITATYGMSTVDFTVTTLPNSNSSGGIARDPIVVRLKPTENLLVGRAGTMLPSAIQVRVLTSSSLQLDQGTPNVALRVSARNTDGTGPTVACEGEGGVALTDANGIATCNLIIGKNLGVTPLDVVIGSSMAMGGGAVNLDVQPGPPSRIRIVRGNNQSGAPGTTLPLAFLAEVTDEAGNPLPGVAVTWEIPVANSITLRNVITTSDSNGRISALGALGSLGGENVVRVKAGEGTASFTFTTRVPVTGLQIARGNSQTAIVGQSFAQPLAVRVSNDRGEPVANVSVAFSVSTGSATLSAATAVTNASGEASVTVTAGSQPGPIRVRAALNELEQTFQLTSRSSGPSFLARNVVNTASNQPGLAACGLSTVYGTGLAPGVNGVVLRNTSSRNEVGLQGVEVLIDGLAAPLLAVSNHNGVESVLFQTPCNVNTATGLTSMTVRVSGAATTVSDVRVRPVHPGIFEVQAGAGQPAFAAAQRPDGSWISPQNPALRGEIVKMLVTGLGQVSPATETNQNGLGGQIVQAPIVVGVNNEGVRVVSAEYAPGHLGIYAISFQIPESTIAGPSQNLAIAAQGPNGYLVFGNTSTIPIR